MTSLIGILILVSALTATSSALSCTLCNSTTSSTCKGDSKTCPSGSHCGSIYIKTHYEKGGEGQTLYRGCIPSSDCDHIGSMSIKGEQITMCTSCCDHDDCIPAIPTLPTINTKPNGVICTSCMSAKSNWCHSSDTIHCTGDEKKCLLQTTETGSESNAFRGCATKTVCDVGSPFYISIDKEQSVKYTFTCTNGGISIHKVFLTPAIVCLLLLKLFL